MGHKRTVRLADHTSVHDKKFRHPIRTSRPRLEVPLTAVSVVLDLRRGCLSSLDTYLRLHGGIPDRRVALELRKLISGSTARTKFKLIAIERPGKKGRPVRGPGDPPTRTQIRQTAAFRKYLEDGDKAEFAADYAAKELRTKPGAIFRSVGAVEKYERYIAETQTELARIGASLGRVGRHRDNALANLRIERRSHLFLPESEKGCN